MKKGFTLIEILVVVSVIVVIMASIAGIMSGVFKSQNKNKATDKINQSGNWILNELKKSTLNANSNDINGGSYFSCPMNNVGTSMMVTNVKDKKKTTIACLNSGVDGYKIASISGEKTVYLFQKNNDLILNNCDQFVICSTLPSLQLSEVKFNFTLTAGSGSLSSGTTGVFSLDVTLRN